MRASLVNTNGLSSLARKYNLHEYIRLGNSFSGDISKANHIIENVFEAFIVALYLDQGFKVTKQVLVGMFLEQIKSFNIDQLTDYKSKLQEEIQAEHRESVSYELVAESGPAHNKRFKVRVLFDGIELGTGEGSTKKEAEQLAAKAALEKEASK
jgi:ribonuclease-3